MEISKDISTFINQISDSRPLIALQLGEKFDSQEVDFKGANVSLVLTPLVIIDFLPCIESSYSNVIQVLMSNDLSSVPTLNHDMCILIDVLLEETIGENVNSRNSFLDSSCHLLSIVGVSLTLVSCAPLMSVAVHTGLDVEEWFYNCLILVFHLKNFLIINFKKYIQCFKKFKFIF